MLSSLVHEEVIRLCTVCIHSTLWPNISGPNIYTIHSTVWLEILVIQIIGNYTSKREKTYLQILILVI